MLNIYSIDNFLYVAPTKCPNGQGQDFSEASVQAYLCLSDNMEIRCLLCCTQGSWYLHTGCHLTWIIHVDNFSVKFLRFKETHTAQAYPDKLCRKSFFRWKSKSCFVKLSIALMSLEEHMELTLNIWKTALFACQGTQLTEPAAELGRL